MARKIKGDLTVENDHQVDGNLVLPNETASRALQLDGSGNIEASTVTTTELATLSGISSDIQTQLDAKADEADVVLRDGTQAFTGDQSMGTNRLTDLAAPTGDNDAARKIDVDTAAAGIKVKDPVDVVSTSNITLSGEQTIDGVLTSTSRVLVAGQTDPVDNGIYVSAAGAWSRATDFDGSPDGEAREGNIVLVLSGTDNTDTHYVLNTTDATDPADIQIGTETNEWVVYSRAEAIQAGDGLDKTGLILSVDVSDFAGTGLEDDGSENLRIASTAAGTGLTGGSGSALAIDFGTTGDRAVSATTLASTSTGEGASLIGVEDAAANFTGTDVEAVLAELQTNIDGKQNDVITTEGDLVIGDGTGEEARLPIGANGTVLQSDGTTAAWQTVSTTDELVKVSANDTTAKYLEDSIVSNDSSLTISTLNDGGDEDLNIVVDESNVDHDALQNFVANEHVDHSGVSVVAGGDDGLTATNNDLTSNIGLSVDINGTTDKAAPVAADEILIADSADTFNLKKADIGSISSAIDHDQTTNFVANEHVDHSGVSVVAGGEDGLVASNNDLTSNIGLSVDIDGTTAETTADNADTILIYDDTASALRKMTRANFIGAGSTSAGDIEETSFAGANNVSVAADVTGLTFANGTVRSFKVHGSIVVDATSDLFEEFELHGIQRASDWVMDDSRTGDDSLVTFTITNAGQVQYTSANYTGFVSLEINFRAITTSV